MRRRPARRCGRPPRTRSSRSSSPTHDGDDRRDGNDWFDLDVEVSVDGEVVDFVTLFTALDPGRRDAHPAVGHLAASRPTRARPAAGAHRRGPGPGRSHRHRRRPGQPVPDQLVGRAGRSRRRHRAVAALGRQRRPAWRPSPPPSRSRRRPASTPRCATTSRRASTGWRSCTATGLGGILADDMGLGKTVQTLALCLHVLEDDPDARFLVVAPTSVVENWAHEAARFAPGLDGPHHRRDRGPAGHHAGRRDRRRPPRRHLLRPVPHRVRGLRQPRVGAAAARRGPVRQEPPGQDLPVRPPPRRRHQDRHHRHAAREHADGPVVAAVDHRARPVPRPEAVQRDVPQADRERRRPRAARHPPAPHRPADAPPHQGRGAHRAAAQDRADRRGRAQPPPRPDLRDPAATAAPEGARPRRRRAEAPLRDPQVAHHPAPARPRPGARRREPRRRRLGQARPPARRPHPGRRRGPPGAGVQPVHPVPGPGAHSPRRRRHRPQRTSTAGPASGTRRSPGSRTATPRCSSSASRPAASA